MSKKKESQGLRNWKHRRERKRAMHDLAKNLLEYATPITSKRNSSDNMETALEVAVLCWNVSFMDEERRREVVSESLKGTGAPENVFTDFHNMVESMVERKRQMFPEDGRMIRSWKLMQDKGRFKISLDWTDIVRTIQTGTGHDEMPEGKTEAQA